MWWYDMHDVVTDYHVTPPVKPDKHSTRAVSIWLFPRTLFGLSSLSLRNNELQQLPATVFSNMTSLRSHLCSCMKLWYDGRDAWCGDRWSSYTTCDTQHPSFAIWLFPRTLWLGLSSLELNSNQLQQLLSCLCALMIVYYLSHLELDSNQLHELPPDVFSSLTSLRSHLCGCMNWGRACA